MEATLHFDITSDDTNDLYCILTTKYTQEP